MDALTLIRIIVFYLLAIASVVTGWFVFQWGAQLWGTGGDLTGGFVAIFSVLVKLCSFLFLVPAAVGVGVGTYDLTMSLKRR